MFSLDLMSSHSTYRRVQAEFIEINEIPAVCRLPSNQTSPSLDSVASNKAEYELDGLGRLRNGGIKALRDIFFFFPNR